MNFNLNPPPSLQGDEHQQLTQIRSYLYQMQQSLVIAMDNLTIENITSDVVLAVQGGASLPDGGQATVHEAYRKLKSLIIKTADTIRSEIEQITIQLGSEYVAVSDFGEYKEEASLEMIATATGILQDYNFDSKLTAANQLITDANTAIDGLNNDLISNSQLIDALNTYNISSQGYIKTGLLFFDENNVPRYGVAVGEGLTTIEVNGEEILRREGLAATFTSDRLSFWQNDTEVAWVSNNQLYIDEANILSRLFIGKWVISHTNGFAIKWSGIGV